MTGDNIEVPQKIHSFLRYHGRSDLAGLLSKSRYELEVSNTYGSRYRSLLTNLVILSPIDKNDQLVRLNSDEREEILRAFHVLYPVRDDEIEIHHIEFMIDPDAEIPGAEDHRYVPDDFDDSFWEKGYLRLFISHPSSIKRLAKDFSDEFKNFGISSFVAHEDIEPTKEWLKTIESALVGCNALLALVTDDFKTSNWCDQEVGIVFGFDKLIIPVRLGVDPYGFFGKFQGIQGAGIRTTDIAEEIASLLSENEKTRKFFAEGVMEVLVKSGSFVEAQHRVKRLYMIKHMNDGMRAKLRDAIENNRHIKNAYYVPEKIEEVIESFG